MDATEIQMIVRKYYEELYAIKFENLDETDKFLEKYNLPNLNEEEAQSLNSWITAGDIKAVLKKLSANKSPRLDGFTGEFYKTFKEELTSILHRLFQKNPRRRKIPKLFMKPTSS